MSDTPPTPPAFPTPPGDPDPSESTSGVPTARPAGKTGPAGTGGAGGGGGSGRINEPSLLDLIDDTCPKCGAKLPHEAVVCVACGYNIKDNVVHRSEIPPTSPTTDDLDLDTDTPEHLDEFVLPGRGSAKTMMIVGGVITLAAMIVAGVVANQTLGGWGVFLKVTVVLYETLLNTGTGVVAVYLTAKVCEKKFGSAELAVGRMLVCFALFELVRHIPIAVPYVGNILELLAAMAVYFLSVWLLFARSRYETAMIAVMHFVLWMLVSLGMMLYYSMGSLTPGGSGSGA